MSLAELKARIRREAAYIDFPNRAWLPPSPVGRNHCYDVVITGGGQSGLAIAYGPMRESVSNLIVLDAAPEGSEGPWTTSARMITLRAPKTLSALDFGNPSLYPRSWWEAKWGAGARNAPDKILRGQWQPYLSWYRQVLGIPVRNNTRVELISPEESGYFIRTAAGDTYLARKVVLATGLDGSGRSEVPEVVRSGPPGDRYAHTADTIDSAALAGKRIAA